MILRYTRVIRFIFVTLLFSACGKPNTPLSSSSSAATSDFETDTRFDQPGSWIRTGGPPGGLGYDIRYNFADPHIWYVTDSYAGVFLSTDDGQTWFPSNDGIPPQAGPSGDAIPIFSLTVDPHNPDIVWAGTNPTGHIYRSLDGGRTWEQRDNGISIDYEGGLSIRGITVDPRSSDIVYAMGETADPITGFAVFGSGTGGQVFKTSDGGENWMKIWDGGMPSSLTRYLWVNPQDPDVLYVSTGIFDRGAVGEGDPDTAPFGGLGILYSEDGGQTWAFRNAANGLESLYIGSLYMHPEDPDILLAAAGHLMPAPYAERLMQEAGSSPHGIFRTTDGGHTWRQTLEPPNERIGEVFTSVELCPSDPDLGYAGSDVAIYHTRDAGQNWELVAGGDSPWGPPGVVAGWPIDMQCDPRDPNRVFANNYNGGNFLSEDGGRTWVNSSRGYTGSQVRSVAVDPKNVGRVYAAARSGIWRSDNGGTDWYGVFFPREGLDPMPVGLEWLVVATDPGQSDHILGGHGMILETIDGGDSWDVSWWSETEGEGPSVVGIVFSVSEPGTVYAALAADGCVMGHEPIQDQCRLPGSGVLASHDGGTTWEYAVDDNLRDLGVLDIAVSPSDPGVIYAATAAGLFKTTNAGQDWDVSLSMEEPVRTVAVNPNDSEIVLVGVEGIGILHSNDGGETWHESAAGLEPNNSLHDIVFNPVDSRIIYTSDFFSGVYRSTNAGERWERINTGLRTRSSLGLGISTDGLHLYVATEGEGVYRLDLNQKPPVSTDESQAMRDVNGVTWVLPPALVGVIYWMRKEILL